MGANLGAMAWHGQNFRRKFGKLGIVVLAGKPNIGKSKEIMTALHMSSSLQYFFAKVGVVLLLPQALIKFKLLGHLFTHFD